jgi:secondary thiamine-phosphate synthase enzyme
MRRRSAAQSGEERDCGVKQRHGDIQVSTRGKGLYEVTREVNAWLGKQQVTTGLLTVFLQHTSASLTIQENADPDVQRDIAEFFERLVPEETPWFRHTVEGPDDMPSHIRSAFTTDAACPGKRLTRTSCAALAAAAAGRARARFPKSCLERVTWIRAACRWESH